MNIKEAGRYANFLESLINDLSSNLTRDKNLYKIIEDHQRKKVNLEAKDEQIEIVVDDKLTCSVNDLAYLVSSLVDEKVGLSLAIEDAKNSIKLDWKENGKNLTIDSAVEYNKKLRNLSSTLETTSNCKNSETIKSGMGKKFNVDGNQVNYTYDVKIVKTVDFDKKVVSDLYKNLLNKTDKISKQIDEALLKDEVNFEPKYSIYDSKEEVIEKYVATKV